MNWLPTKVRLVFLRENRSFFENRMVLLMFLVQVLVMVTIQGVILSKLAPALRTQPQILQPIFNRLFSVQLVGMSLLSVMHVVQLTTLREKASGLLESLLTTPLSVHDLVVGKMLHTSLMGLFSGGIFSISVVAVTSFSVGSFGFLFHVPLQYLLFAAFVAPMVVTGVLGLVTLLVYRAKEPTLVIMPFTIGVMLLIGIGSIPNFPWLSMALHIVLMLLAVGSHLFTWLLARHTDKEKLVCG